MTSKLTIGLATFQDTDGCYFTLESLHAHHPHVEYLVIDNAPASDIRVASVTRAIGGRYLHRPDLHGTAPPRDALFRLATTEWVMSLDSHVLLELGAVQSLLDYIDANPESNDLLTGPLIHDDGKGVSTHWRQTEPPGLWGTWDFDPRGAPDASKIGCGKGQCDCRRTQKPPFEIPMQGLGLFAMRRQAWPGFHPLHRGFGGEEGYIHEKVRQNGGRCLCLPALGWRHRFRHMEHGAPPPPYRLAKEDHVWNLLAEHRELGVEATEVIGKVFGKDLPTGVFDALVKGAEQQQPFGQRMERKRLKLLGVWYTNNAAPEKLLQASLGSIQRATQETMFHEVMVTTSSWKRIDGNPFLAVINKPDRQGHAAIVCQIQASIDRSHPYAYDAVVFLEHDVLYPPDYFDRVGNALAAGVPVVSNLDYEGMNATGWLRVKERHEPMHQLSMRRDVALENLERCEKECQEAGSCLLEPQGDRGNWVRVQPQGLCPSVHVCHEAGRFTSHCEVCYDASSQGRLVHPFWGDYRNYWPGEAKPASGSGCSSCGQGPPPPPVFQTIEEWFERVREAPSDFNEHMVTLRDLAGKSEVAVELSRWLKPSCLSLAAGKPRKLVSVCPGAKPEWPQIKQLLDGVTEVKTILSESLLTEPFAHDLLFIDTWHQAEVLIAELNRWAPHCTHRIVIHCTITFGEKGDNGGPGVLPALRLFLKENKQWFVMSHYTNNNGLVVLSCDPADKKPLPSGLKMAWNYTKALTRHVATGRQTLPQVEIEKRLEVCLTCDQRVDNRCAVCGCYLDEGPNGEEGKTMWPEQSCPLGKWTEIAL